MEKRDLYDINRKLTGETIYKNEKIPANRYILVVLVFIQNSQGKFVHQTKVFGVKASYIKIIVSQNVDKDGFMIIDEEQEKLPFD